MSYSLPHVSVLLLAALAGSATCSPADQYSEHGPLNLAFSKMALFNEDPCVKEGGQCLEEAECPAGKLATARGLCPEQQKRGVECCHGVAVSVKDCRGRGGECTSNSCPANLVEPADDCKDDQVCCVLV